MTITFADAIEAGVTTTENAMNLYDGLAPVPLDFMVGTWRGAEFPTGHPLDGLLEASGWYGKYFGDAETVHPLLFYTANRTRVFAVDPGRIPIGFQHLGSLPLPKHRNLHALVVASRPVMQTRHPKARLRMTEYRGQVSATMIYDDLPINDIFRMVDNNTVLGVMDLRGVSQPYFFVLRRDTSATLV